MGYLVQTKFDNNFKDFHLKDCIYVENYETLEPSKEGLLPIDAYFSRWLSDNQENDPECISQLKLVGLDVDELNRVLMHQIRVYKLTEGESPSGGVSYGWFNYQWLPLRQAKREVEAFIDTL